MRVLYISVTYLGQHGIWDVPVVLLVFAKQGEVVIPLFVFCPLVDNNGIIGLQQENSHYFQCFLPAQQSPLTGSPLGILIKHCHQTTRPPPTLNPPMHSATGAPLVSLSYPNPLYLPPLKHIHFTLPLLPALWWQTGNLPLLKCS